MWPFRRKEQTPAPVTIMTPAIRSDWKGMPALQRAIGEHPLTAPGEAFAGDLATRHDPSVVSRTLGHHVSAEAPSGLVLAIGSTTTRSDGPTMTARPRVQRRVASAAEAVEQDLEATDMPMPSGPPAEPPTATGVPADLPVTSASMAGRPSGSTGVVQTYRRELPIVATAEPAVENLTGLAPDAMPVPVGPGRKYEMQRSMAPSNSPAPAQDTIPMVPLDLGSASTPARLTLGQSRRLGLGAPLRQVPATLVQRTTAGGEVPIQAASPTTGEASAPAGAATPVLDAASASPGKASPTVQAASMPLPELTYRSLQKTASAPQATGTEMRDSRPTESPSQLLPVIPGSPARPDSPERLTVNRTERLEPAPAPAPQLPLQRVVRDAPLQKPVSEPVAIQLTPSAPAAITPMTERAAVEAASQAKPPASAGTTIQRARTEGEPGPALVTAAAPTTAHDPSMSLAPLLGARNLRTVSIQRLSEQPGQASHADTQAMPLVARSADDYALVARSADDDAPVTGPTDIAEVTYWPTTHSSGSQELSSFAGANSTADPTSQSSAQRVVAPMRPLGVAVQRQAAEKAPLREASRSLPLAPMATMASIQRAQVATMESVQNAIAESTAPITFPADPSRPFGAGRAMNLQRAEDEASIAAAPSSSSATASSPVESPLEHASGATTESEMDALAGRLYERIRGRLKSELLVDRERAGLLTDLR